MQIGVCIKDNITRNYRKHIKNYKVTNESKIDRVEFTF